MFRTLTLSALLAASTFCGLTFTPATASADPAIRYAERGVHHGRFDVLVRHRGHWDVRGSYRNREEAIREARRLEHRGLDARVEWVRG